MWGRRWIRAEIWRNANEREREDYSSARFVDVSFLYLTLPLKRKKKLCSCNSVNKKICVLADRGQHWACKCRGGVADVEVALQWSHHPPLYKLHKSLKEGNTLNEEERRESERERERIYIEHICNIPSFRIAERLVWFTARDNLGDTHAWWENDASFRKFSCSPTFISPPCNIQTLFSTQYAGAAFCDWNLRMQSNSCGWIWPRLCILQYPGIQICDRKRVASTFLCAA